MKSLKSLLSICLTVAVLIFGCTQDDDNTDFLNAVPAPTNVSALITVSQDNTGLVTITPLGENVATFEVNFGDGSETSGTLNPGESTQKVYDEGSYEIVVTATGINGKNTAVNQSFEVSFQAPQNLMVTIENDPAVSRKVNVMASAEFAMSYEVDFGVDDDDEDSIMGNIDETISYTYEEIGTYTITVTAFSAATETTIYTEEFTVTEITQPLVAAPTPPNRNDADVISMYSNTYGNEVNVSSWRSDWSTSTLTDIQIEGNDVKSYVDADFVGVEFYGDAAVDASNMEFFSLDVWTTNATTFRVKLVDLGADEGTEAEIVFEDLALNEWVTLEIPMSQFTDAGMTRINSIQQLIFSGLPTGTFDFFIDNVYFYKAPPAFTETLVGTWKMAPEAGSLGVGPTVGDTSWFACDADCVTARDCYFDDTYTFNADGTYAIDLGAETFIEDWQGGDFACGAPVAPYDGSGSYTYTWDETSGSLTVNGEGAYVALPKANNQGELPNVAVPSSITYQVSFLDANTISVYVEAGAGVFWQYKMIREAATNPLVGTWVMASEAGSLGVGPAVGDISWFSCDDACVAERGCYFDDTYTFNADGSYDINLGADTFIEDWQGGTFACGAPVAPYDGSGDYTYTYNAGAGTVTVNGTGAFIGLPKANNQGELPNVDVPTAITYTISFADDNTINVYVESGSGVFWQYKLIKQ